MLHSRPIYICGRRAKAQEKISMTNNKIQKRMEDRIEAALSALQDANQNKPSAELTRRLNRLNDFYHKRYGQVYVPKAIRIMEGNYGD